MRPRPAAPGEPGEARTGWDGGITTPGKVHPGSRVPVLTLTGSLREFVEREVSNFARQNPGVVIYVNSRPCAVPRVVAEYREWGWARAGGRDLDLTC